MRICIATDYYFPQLGGITEHVHGQARSLAARGHEVTILTGRLLHAPPTIDRDDRVLDDERVEIARMGLALPLYGNGSQTLHTLIPRGRRALRRFFAERRFDVVHVHAPYNPSSFMLAPFALPPDTIAVGTYHSVFTPGLVRDLVGPATHASLRRLHGHVVVSQACIPPLTHYFPDLDYRVIPNGIDEEHFRPDAEHIECIPEGEGPVILFVGRFDPRNGLGTMLEAFEQVWRARDGNVRLCVVGDGPLRAHYARRLSEDVAGSVRFVGRIDWNRPRYYASADILCSPCLKASFGMVLLEGMSCGVPIVASRISGFELLVEHGREGVLVAPADDPASFAAAIGPLLDAPAERKRMGAEGRHTAVSRYAWHRVAGELEAYYAELRGDRLARDLVRAAHGRAVTTTTSAVISTRVPS